MGQRLNDLLTNSLEKLLIGTLAQTLILRGRVGSHPASRRFLEFVEEIGGSASIGPKALIVPDASGVLIRLGQGTFIFF